MKRGRPSKQVTKQAPPTVAEVLEARGKTHGNFSDQAGCAQALKNVMEGYAIQDLSMVQAEAVAMICHKLARIATGNPGVKDHWVDIAGYAMLVADRLPD